MHAIAESDLKYCIRGSANIWGGYIIDLFLEMDEWLARHCRAGYAITKYDEVKFADRFEAVAFARKWFETGRWRLHFMDTGCSISACSVRRNRCPREDALYQ